MANSYEQRRLPVTQFTEDEEMVRDAARHWANEELRPLVRDMDNECKTRPDVIQGLFDHGFMGMVSSAVYFKNSLQRQLYIEYTHFSLHQPTHMLT